MKSRVWSWEFGPKRSSRFALQTSILNGIVAKSYYRTRYYDPSIGRFLSEDPQEFNASVNFYVYVDNDPANWMDPTGLDKVEVCCRPLRKAKPFLMLWKHCYIKITDDGGRTDTWGILPDKKGVQKPVKNDPRNSGGKCKNAPGNQCNIDKLRKGLDEDADSGDCPSCGPAYHNWWWRFAGYNSNTFVYNMISEAGLIPPASLALRGITLLPANGITKESGCGHEIPSLPFVGFCSQQYIWFENRMYRAACSCIGD